jgi:hypothetical protein
MMTTPRRIATSFLIILALAAVFRFGFLYKNWNNLDFAPVSLMHAEVARNILNGNWFQIDQQHLQNTLEECRTRGALLDPSEFHAPVNEQLTPLFEEEPGYGLLMAGMWKLTGSRSWWPIRGLQILIDLVMCWLVYQIGRKVFNERTGILASLLYACFVPGIELVVRPHRDIWVTFLFISTVYQLVMLRDSKRPWLQILSIGVATGIVAWMRSTVLLYVVFMVPILFVVRSRREAIRCSAILIAAFALAFSPLIARNYVTFDRFMATRGVFWHSFWAGVGQMPNPYNLQDDDETIVRFAQSLDSTAGRQTIAYEQVLKTEAFKFIREHPVWYVTSIVRRAIVFVAPKIGRELFFQPLLPKHVTGTLNLSISKIALLAIDALVTCLFLAGVWLTRRRWKDLLMVGLPYLYTMATLAPFYLVGRNIMNVYFVVLILTSVTIAHLWHRIRPETPGA